MHLKKICFLFIFYKLRTRFFSLFSFTYVRHCIFFLNTHCWCCYSLCYVYSVFINQIGTNTKGIAYLTMVFYPWKLLNFFFLFLPNKIAINVFFFNDSIRSDCSSAQNIWWLCECVMCMCEKLMCLSRIPFERQKISILMALLLLFFLLFLFNKKYSTTKERKRKIDFGWTNWYITRA